MWKTLFCFTFTRGRGLGVCFGEYYDKATDEILYTIEICQIVNNIQSIKIILVSPNYEIVLKLSNVYRNIELFSIVPSENITLNFLCYILVWV